MAYQKLTPIVATGSTATRYLADRFADMVNVMNFGAKGDGTTDDADALQDAFDFASTSKSLLVDLQGRKYLIKKPLSINRDWIIVQNGTIICAENESDADAWVQEDTTYGYEVAPAVTISSSGTGHCFFKNITVDCNYVASGFNSKNNAWDITFENVDVFHMADNGYGILSEGRQNVFNTVRVWEHSYKQDPTQYEPFLADGIICSIGDCKFNGCVVWLCRNGIILYEGTHIVSNTHVWNCCYPEDGDEANNIVLYACHNTQFSNIYLDNGSFRFYNTTNISISNIYVLRNYSAVDSDFVPFVFVTSSANRNLFKFQLRGLAFDWNDTYGNQMFKFETRGDGSWKDGTSALTSVYDTSFFGQNGGLALCSTTNNSAFPLSLRSTYTDECGLVLRNKGNTKTGALVLRSDGSVDIGIGNSNSTAFSVKQAHVNDTRATVTGAYDSGYTGLKIDTAKQQAFVSLLGYFYDGTTSGTTSVAFAVNGTVICSISSNGLQPSTDNTYSLGMSNRRWTEVHAATGTIQTSDERYKHGIQSISEPVFNAWEKVGFKVFQMLDAVEKKGENARLHVGVVAQEVAAAFESEGLDAARYGLFCYDKWDDEYVVENIVDSEAVLDSDGNVVTPEITHTEKKLVNKAGDMYGIRYEEALALECAYLRSRISKMQEQIDALTAAVSQLTSQLNG